MLVRVTSVFILLALPTHSARRLTTTTLADGASDLTVHEWGTFTTVAGEDGHAIDWLPLGGPTDLPCFVERFQNRADVKLSPTQPTPLDYTSARSSLWGKVRMETPVLYFYTKRPGNVNVRVRFPRGLMTEWYPRATVSQPLVDRTTLRRAPRESVIEWRNVNVVPNAPRHFPVDVGESHYYAARNTDAVPLVVDGLSERFLFYRGVASFDVPLSAVALGNGRVRVRNLGADALPALVLFENRDGVIRYRAHGALSGETVVALPTRVGSATRVRRDLERMLVAAGLYPKEAAAMVESWRDSWFEEGTRVFYIIPPRAVDAILALTVEPVPTHVARVFVGRMEVITPATQRSVENAVAANDATILERYGRFLGPITDRMLARHPDSVTAAHIQKVRGATFTSFLHRVSACE